MHLSHKIKPPESSGKYTSESCSVITIMNPDKDMGCITNNNNFNMYQNAILDYELNYSNGMARLIVKKGKETELVKLLHQSLFD